jgi:cytochrome bd-type quinol oxidase subunit 1
MKEQIPEKMLVSAFGFLILSFLSMSLTSFLNDMLDAYHGITIPGGDVAEQWTVMILFVAYGLAFVGYLIGYIGWFSRDENQKKRWYLIVIFGAFLPAYFISATWIHDGFSYLPASEMENQFTKNLIKQAALTSQAILLCFFIFQITFGIWVDAMFRIFKPTCTGKNEAR